MEAFLYEKLENGKVRCNICSHECIIKPGLRGICGVRENKKGRLETLVFNKIIANHVDPIEKKPLFHLLPGSLSYSVATVGCNFKCKFCQNSDIAQMPADCGGLITGKETSPAQIVADALRSGCESIAYTYTEPTVYFELAYETAKLAHEKGLKNIFVTNGYMSEKAFEMIKPYLDGANVDLKAFTNEFYKNLCKAKLNPVKETLTRMKKAGVIVEITTLLIPGENDDMNELESLAGFICRDLGAETPWHINRFHPTYLLTDKKPTPVESMIRAAETGKNAGLQFIYLGNVPGTGGEDTICPKCSAKLIERIGFHVRQSKIVENKCPECGFEIYGIFS